MASVNDLLVDEAIRHQVDLAKHSNQTVRRMMAILNRTDARLYAELSAALERMDARSFTVERLESLLGSVRAINAQAYAQVGDDLRQELRDFVEYEASYQRQALVALVPAQVHVASVSAEVVYAAALSRPFQGVILKGALDDLEAGKAKLIRRAIAQGFTEGKTTAAIIREIRGTRARGYADGLAEVTRRDAEAVTRTALGHTAGFVQDRFSDANADIIKAVQWSATLDLRTSPVCRVRDGKLYEPVIHKPIGHSLPWLGGPGRAHWRCRSAQVYVLKSLKELGIDIDGALGASSTRASMDGQLPADLSYGDWLKKQSAARQIEVLGPTRAKLMRDGKLPLEAMYSQKGTYKTLEQLRESDAAAFTRAGL